MEVKDVFVNFIVCLDIMKKIKKWIISLFCSHKYVSTITVCKPKFICKNKNTYNSRLVYNIYYRNVCDKCGKVFYEHKVATNLKPGEVYTRFKIKV